MDAIYYSRLCITDCTGQVGGGRVQEDEKATVIEQSARRGDVSLSTTLALLGCVRRGDHSYDKVTLDQQGHL